ncbi:MAG TPA: amidase family protein, partial [Ilumatobacteraceae bacterium]|nr:amidase family protein [Ilumatobacteraceae bacterium]
MTSLELLDAYLARVDALNPALNAIVVDDRERARKAAKAADRAVQAGKKLGPLHGVPMTVKEAFAIPGHPVTYGSPALADNVLDIDAVAVARLRAAGAVIFGKTNVPIGLSDFQSYNAVYGTTNNPWDTSRGAGGSSGGSAAALAAGLTALEFGSDIGGSIRNPAAYNGVYGHKPTWGIIPERGHSIVAQPGAEGAISVVGPLARSAGDLALALRVTAGPDLEFGYRLDLPAPPTSVKGLRIAVWLREPELGPVDEEVVAPIEAAAKALAQAGAKVSFTARPAFDPRAAHDTYMQILMAAMSTGVPDFAAMVRRAERLDPDDRGPHAFNLRASTARYRDVALAQNAQARIR